jgi:MSHA biogenesis protein MshP
MRRKPERGVSMISAIFLLVVIAVLGAYIASVSTTQHSTATLDLQGSKAYQAAYAGIQFGAYQVIQNGGACATTSIGLTGVLAGFAVTVQCTNTTLPSGYTEGSATRNIYRIISTGCSPASAGACPGVQGGYYVERQLEATIDK